MSASVQECGRYLLAAWESDFTNCSTKAVHWGERVVRISHMGHTWKSVSMRKAPSLRAVPSSGRLPQASLMERTKGRTIPPLLAATLGIAGASRASLHPQQSAQSCRRQQRFTASTVRAIRM